MTMRDQLARRTPSVRKAEAENDVVEPSLEKLQQGFAGDAFFLLRMVIGIAELTLKQPVDTAQLLFFAQLQAITNQGLATTHRVAMLSGRLRTALFNRTRRLIAPVTFKKKLCAFAAA